jgi:hypothetical protein
LTVRIVPHVLRPKASIATRLTSGDEWPTVPRVEAGCTGYPTSSVFRKDKYFCAVRLTRRAKQAAGFAVLPVVLKMQQRGREFSYLAPACEER